MTPDEKLCPYCGETIKSIAIKCRHCKSNLMQEIAPSPVETKNCTTCGESIEISATDCPHCKSNLIVGKELNDSFSQNKMSTLDYDIKKFERNALIYTGYASAVFNAIYYLLIDKYFSQNLYVLALIFNISVSMFCAVMYIKDRKQFTQEERYGIPWYSNLFFILFFAVISIPLYLAWVARKSNTKSDAIKAFIGYAIAISIGIFASISVTNKIMAEFGFDSGEIETNKIIEPQRQLENNETANRSIQNLIEKVDQLNNECQGGSGDDKKTVDACDKRDILNKQINQLGWCYGKKNEPSFQMKWHKCEMYSYRNI